LTAYERIGTLPVMKLIRRAGPVLGPVATALERAGVRDSAVLVAVSGGIDSMVLLDVLVRLQRRFGLRLAVGHVHHGLRGRSADRDSALVKATAIRLGLACAVNRLTPTTKRRGTSVEMWARDARYQTLEAQRKAVRADWIVTAHSRNDQAETVLLNLLRGSGPRGLAGIPLARGRIVRPLLAVGRPAIGAYAAAHGVPYRDDPTNRSGVYLRNRIRRELLPALSAYNPRIVDALVGLASDLREDDDALQRAAGLIMDGAARGESGRVRVRAADLAGVAPALQRRVLLEAFRRVSGGQHGLTRRHLALLSGLLHKPSAVRLPGGMGAVRDGNDVVIGADTLLVARAEATQVDVPLPPGVWTPFGSVMVRLRLARKRPVLGGAKKEVLAPSVLDAPLCIRNWRPGDRFQPLGVHGSKKLQDFFVDLKIPKPDRHRIPLVCSGETIAWVIGHRIAEPFRYRGERCACVAEYRALL